MKFGVNKKVLLYTAGCVWIFAGINILRIGIVTWLNDTHYWLFKIGEATIVFLLFFNLVFKRLFYKHSERISRKNGKHCPFYTGLSTALIITGFLFLRQGKTVGN